MISILATRFLIGISMQLAWDQSVSPNVTGYNIYCGIQSQTYTEKFTVGNFLTYGIRSMQPSQTYYFAATAYDSFGDESVYSNEVSFTVPSKTLTLSIDPSGFIGVNAFDGGTFELQQTQSLSSPLWTQYAKFQMSGDQAEIPVATNALQMNFFRLHQLSGATPAGVNILQPSGASNLVMQQQGTPSMAQVMRAQLKPSAVIAPPKMLTFWQKVRHFFRYRPGHHFMMVKGATLLMMHPTPKPQLPPMPPMP